MKRQRLSLLVWIVALAMITAACGEASDRSTSGADALEEPGSNADHDHDDADNHDHMDDDAQHPDDEHDHADMSDLDSSGDDAEVGDARPSSTQGTLEVLRTMDPARLAELHQHDDHGHDHESASHPNGIDPERIVIPAIDVDADVIDLGLESNGEMEVPTDFSQTGWFTPGPRPGRVGPAVIAGHVDSRTGPAVFSDLVELQPGDEIEVHGDEDAVTFVVRETEQHPKDAFPTEKVYAGTPGPELRLITCGGDFDDSERSYRDNIIVYAERVDS